MNSQAPRNISVVHQSVHNVINLEASARDNGLSGIKETCVKSNLGYSNMKTIHHLIYFQLSGIQINLAAI